MIALALLLFVGCTPDCEDEDGCLVGEDVPAGLLTVRTGSEAGDVWIAGASPDPADGTGPVVMHLQGDVWERLDTAAWDGGEIWWAWVADTEVVFAGTDGLLLELDRTSGELAQVPGPDAGTTFFGVWGASADDVWAVGQTDGGQGPPALWRRLDGTWAAWQDDVLGPGSDRDVYFKVHGTSADDVWIVGTRGIALHWDGVALVSVPTDAEIDTSGAPLLTVDATGDRPVAVGGAGNGLILEFDGSQWVDLSPAFQPGFNGVCGGNQGWAVGQYGARASRDDSGTWLSDTERDVAPVTREDWHGCAVDADGGLWTVGGRIASRPLIRGVVAYTGTAGVPPIAP